MPLPATGTVLATLAALVLIAVLVEPARRVALRYGLTDRPAPHKAHHQVTPYLGGAAIVVATLVPAVAVIEPTGYRIWLVLGAALCIALLGLVDDARTLRPSTRMAVEALLATAVALGGVRLHLVGQDQLDLALTVGWIIVVTNSFNLLDNTDGALATVACATAVPLAVFAVVAGMPELALLLLCLAAACTGFLLHNAAPARIFMGDSGSLFIGFLIATSAAMVAPGRAPVDRASILLLIVFVAATDTGLVLVSRQLAGRSWLQGGTDHVAHRLKRAGVGPHALLGTLFLGASTAGLVAVLVSAGVVPGSTALLGTFGAAVLLIVLLMQVPSGYGRPARHAQRRPAAGRTRDTVRG
ncbi:UDP-GlcNAc:undecaprenyl-phosphate GlcNAc-1-phosphate transferase [Micromonospora pisi]|uniref:UDP-GlcNAc:undecaprenyl-phosphate GlcNAc-1-phosphate transferase n=1 Tax=Micromonospora pisi TaxID=589240 RepID=A0A495JCF5_9ACTN|nr:MraY family glycosyltransferase [Micromonospora pisi]RKR86042.1 UDP-GlcNAc:undecaprenyl-phosphate GlcNAc-1-phosphate transferase [Micromonospora pisi]